MGFKIEKTVTVNFVVSYGIVMHWPEMRGATAEQ